MVEQAKVSSKKKSSNRKLCHFDAKRYAEVVKKVAFLPIIYSIA